MTAKRFFFCFSVLNIYIINAILSIDYDTKPSRCQRQRTKLNSVIYLKDWFWISDLPAGQNDPAELKSSFLWTTFYCLIMDLLCNCLACTLPHANRKNSEMTFYFYFSFCAKEKCWKKKRIKQNCNALNEQQNQSSPFNLSKNNK